MENKRIDTLVLPIEPKAARPPRLDRNGSVWAAAAKLGRYLMSGMTQEEREGPRPAAAARHIPHGGGGMRAAGRVGRLRVRPPHEIARPLPARRRSMVRGVHVGVPRVALRHACLAVEP